MPVNKIFIPTFISSINYNPARVLPHIYFYNGLKACEPYYFQGYSNGNTGSVVSNERQSFPYFDNYEGNNPVSSSRSLLFFNEPAVYGDTPTNSLYTEYWSNYINLLYNPRTRLINCEAIIPLADYFKMELNDICEWRGNYYHLRAINDYNLANGECKLQLLGPILDDILPNIIPAIACDFRYEVSACSSSLEFIKVGDSAFGGIVAYVDDCGCNGFVVSTGSLGNYEWGCESTSSIIPTDPNDLDYQIGMGWINTQVILENCGDRPIAASVANAYTSSGFNNWMLPSIDEWKEIVSNKTIINAAGGNISGSYSWTSNTENGISGSKLLAITKDLNTIDGLGDSTRDTLLPVYAIRYFGSCFNRITTTTTTCAPTGSTTTTTTLAPTTTTTTIAPPSGACVDIDFQLESEEYLDCGIFNLFNAYTASYFVDCTASNAPTDINVYITASASGGGTLTYTLTIPSGQHQGFENVYIREWTGTCTNRESTTYSIVGVNIDGYPSCSCDYNAFTNCGRGDTVGEACDDAIANARTFYSDCTAGTFGGGCVVYTTPSGTPLTGYTRIFMNGSNWDISSTTGVVSGASSTQC